MYMVISIIDKVFNAVMMQQKFMKLICDLNNVHVHFNPWINFLLDFYLPSFEIYSQNYDVAHERGLTENIVTPWGGFEKVFWFDIFQ